jgi:hypothetical protein
MKIWVALLIILVLGGCAMASRESQLQTALSLTKEHFKNTASLKDDSLDTVATITTINGFQERRGLLGIVWDDNFLRAFIEKKSGKLTFQVYQVITYQGDGWKTFQSVNFETPNGPQSKPLIAIKHNVDCTGSRYSGCTFVEHVAFDVDENLLRIIARNYSPGQPVAWKFKLNAKSGEDYNDGILPAEVAGLLERVDEYVVGAGLSQPTRK